MPSSRVVLRVCISGALIAAASSALPAQTSSGAIHPSLFSEMRWRAIGPSRGGRTKSAAGVPSQPYTFYMGVCNGGVWKTTDAGRTWKPIFDDQETGSIGSVVVALSDPNVIYVGSGEGLARPDLSVGDGVFKSTDAGKTWTHLPGLREAQQIPNIAVDPRNPNRLFVAVFGHPYGPSKERGIYRSLDGGQTFQAVLQKDENIGGNDVDIDPSDPNIVYATTWEERQGPWEDAQWRGTGGGIFKSTDGGATWRQLKGDITQANLAISPSNPKRLYAAIAIGPATSFWRSDDAGETWTEMSNRGVGRIGGGDLSVPAVDPKNADTIITANTVSYKSTDGGKTWVPFKGAPGGDDYQNVWINPNDPNIVMLASDQGAVITLNGGQSWSSWYNQPTAQLYHVNTDNDFPYRVCSGQQESGSACVSSRGNDGQITFREWHPVAVEEYGYAVPDPKDPNIVFGGKVTRYDRRTTQNANVSPTGGRGGGPTAGPPARAARTQPLAFSPVDPHILFYGNNVLWKTIDQGITWKQISPEMNRKSWVVPKTIAKYAPPNLGTGAPNARSGLIYSIAPSYVDVNRIWVGTDDGTIHTSADGGVTWTDVTPKAMTPFMKIFNMDAGRFDGLTAYAAANTLRLDDMRPHLFRTHDGGKTWAEIVTGLDAAGPTSTIREDPKKKGLLYAGSERHVWVSFDDGDHWQTLKLNMGSSSVRDITVHDDDLIAATHGRGFWILDDVTPLRQISAGSANEDAILFKPTTAWRVRWNTNTDTPLPPDESNLQNPPEGAIINYYLKAAANGPVTLEILTTDGTLVRKYSSADPVAPLPDPTQSNLPLYWFRPPQGLSAAAGMHRFTWDVHYQPIGGGGGGGRGGGIALPIAAVPYNTVPVPSTPWVNPGTYTLKLTVNGKSYTQPIVVKQDPRVKTPAPTMQSVYASTKTLYFNASEAQTTLQQVRDIRGQVEKLKAQAKGATLTALESFDKRAAIAEVGNPSPPPAGGPAGGGGGAGGGRGGGPQAAPDSLVGLVGSLPALASSLTAADVQPNALTQKGVTEAMANFAKVKAAVQALRIDLDALNLKLKAAGLAPIAK